jgi:nitroimidazol reductase NimA-like FMN-containing flavoprotein (pyridoxamine 5'-phosphate oxidase superfamily)
MRRKDREIESVEEKLAIISKCKVCRLAMTDGNTPYVIPLNFGYEYTDEILTLYFHGAGEGMKIDILKKNPSVCFEMDCEHQLIEADTPSAYSYAYASVIGFGSVMFIEEPREKSAALNVLMKHQMGKGDFVFTERELARVCVYKVRAESFTGKRRPAH